MGVTSAPVLLLSHHILNHNMAFPFSVSVSHTNTYKYSQSDTLTSTGSLSLLNTWIYSIFSSKHLFISLPVVFVVDSHPALPPWALTSLHSVVTEYILGMKSTSYTNKLPNTAMLNIVTLNAKKHSQVMQKKKHLSVSSTVAVSSWLGSV